MCVIRTNTVNTKLSFTTATCRLVDLFKAAKGTCVLMTISLYIVWNVLWFLMIDYKHILHYITWVVINVMDLLWSSFDEGNAYNWFGRFRKTLNTYVHKYTAILPYLACCGSGHSTNRNFLSKFHFLSTILGSKK